MKNDRVKMICDMITDGSSAKEIAEKTDCHIMNVYGIARRYGLKLTRKKTTADRYSKAIEGMTYLGMSDAEIAAELNISKETVRNVRRQLGIKGEDPHRNRHTEDEAALLISKAAPSLEYISGYENKDSKVTVRCRECGQIFVRSFSGIVNQGHVGCPECRAIEQEAKDKAKAEAKVRAKAERRRNIQQRRRKRISRMEDQGQLTFTVCPVCGAMTLRPKYCSDKCARKAENKCHELIRERRVKTAMVDKDITVQGLFKRDGGICQICGKSCRLDDYVMVNGQKQCGDWYPSIDHIKPLSKGGMHSWDNVQLAHRICNSIKSDKV